MDRFDTSFNAIFDPNSQNLKNMEFYVQTGNHDYRGNITAEILYTNLQNRWKLPDLWYSIPNLDNFSNFTVAFITVDTDVMKGSYSTDQDKNDVANKQKNQYDWLRSELTKYENFDYIIVAGHHPIFSISSHGTQSFLLETFYPMLQEFDVNLYLNGHDHNLQSLTSTYVSTRTDLNTTMYHTVAGQGGKYDCSTKHNSDLPSYASSHFFWCGNGNEGGYSQAEVNQDRMTLKQINARNDMVLYTVEMGKRRN